MTEKGPAAFRTISEASTEVGVPSHVLRFWETRFAFIRPMKRSGGRRFYRPHDLQVLRGVRALLHDEGYTIKGVQKLHKEGGVGRLVEAASQTDDSVAAVSRPDERVVPAAGEGAAPMLRPLVFDAGARGRLTAALGDLESVKAQIDALLARSAAG